MSIQSHIMCKPVLQKCTSSLQLNFTIFVGPFHLNYSVLFMRFTPMPCCSFHMLLSHKEPHPGVPLQLCSGFILLKGRYCCLLRVQHSYISLSGVYPDDMQDTDKFHFPSVFSREFSTGRASRLPSTAQTGGCFLRPSLRGSKETGQRALGTPGCPLTPGISLPGRGTYRRHGRSVSLDLQIQHLAVVALQDFSLGESVFAPGTISLFCTAGGQPSVSLPLQSSTSVFPCNKQLIIRALHEALKSHRSVGKSG